MNKSKRIVSNTLLLFIRMFVLTLVNLYSLRIVISGLGDADYGLYVTVSSIVATMVCINGVLTLSIQRFLSFSLGKNDKQELNDVFSASISVTFILSLLTVFFFETIGYWFLCSQMVIPVERLAVAKIVYHFSIFTFVLSMIQIPFNAAIIAHEEMGLFALISSIECFLKLFVAVLIGTFYFDKLEFYGIGLFVVGVMVFIMYLVTAGLRYSECHYRKIVDKSLYRRILFFSGWTFYGSLSHMGMIQGSTLLLNMFFGILVNKSFGVALQVNNAFTQLGNSMIMALRPAMIKAYADGQHKYLHKLFNFGNKFILYVLLIVSIPLISEMDFILKLWLKSNSHETVIFCQLMIVYVDCLALQGPITTIIQAIGKIKEYHLPVETITLMCVPVSYFFFSIGAPSYVIFYVIIGICILAQVVRIWCLKRFYPFFSVKDYVCSFLCPSLFIICVAVISEIAIRCCNLNDSMRLFANCFLLPLAIIILVSLVGMNRSEKIFLLSMIRRNKTNNRGTEESENKIVERNLL